MLVSRSFLQLWKLIKNFYFKFQKFKIYAFLFLTHQKKMFFLFYFLGSEDKSGFTKVVLQGLIPEHKYQIKVFAGNAVGLSTKSYDLSVQTLTVSKYHFMSDDLIINMLTFNWTPHELLPFFFFFPPPAINRSITFTTTTTNNKNIFLVLDDSNQLVSKFPF